jgi:hypothetical protein
MKIYIKGIFVPLGDAQIRVYRGSTNAIIYKENKIEFSTDSGKISAIKGYELSEEEVTYLQDLEKKIPINNKLEEYLTEQYNAVQTIVQYIKIFDAIYPIDDQTHMTSKYEWSNDYKVWHPVPDKRVYTWRGSGLISVLPDNFLGNIEVLANKNIPLFFAFTHLHKAFQDTSPRHKWINATIAAEHAFKEFLSLKDPRSQRLMTHIPSPPIEKLYKSVLFDYTGHESSMYKELQKGAQKRNDLIHKPSTPSPNLKETNIYLHHVEVAIFELYTLLYPKNQFFEYLLQKAKERLQHVIAGGDYFQ